ncbi:uncharacterized protein [Physcomitrium patens]|uniref:uncharacterized protein n=1 Tax=Physcomitrium patens TaxID=3218 RepID=UPI000D15EF9B|nr:uncharacterized protein LOC112278446 [Physcomitrium patens]|eukprot:XP_024367731.1 uncharacterized protein LOC112278446 [Physcomitrella patens]
MCGARERGGGAAYRASCPDRLLADWIYRDPSAITTPSIYGGGEASQSVRGKWQGISSSIGRQHCGPVDENTAVRGFATLFAGRYEASRDWDAGCASCCASAADLRGFVSGGCFGAPRALICILVRLIRSSAQTQPVSFVDT